MSALAGPVERLIEELSRLPGIGPKTASRLTFHLLRLPRQQTDDLVQALQDLRAKVVYCERCFNIAERTPCAICADPGRDRAVICVVEEPLDVHAIERSNEFRGQYHVLHGAISPVDGIGPEDLRISELVARLKCDEEVTEVVVATNPNMEGEATAMYLARVIRPLSVRVTRLARGLPMGGDLEYADSVTLARALEGRSEI